MARLGARAYSVRCFFNNPTTTPRAPSREGTDDKPVLRQCLSKPAITQAPQLLLLQFSYIFRVCKLRTISELDCLVKEVAGAKLGT